MPRYEVELDYDAPYIRRLIWHSLQAKKLWHIIGMLFLGFCTLLYLKFFGSATGILTDITLGAVGAILLMQLTGLWMSYRQNMESLNRDEKTRLVMDEESLALINPTTRISFKWCALVVVWRYDGAWLLGTSAVDYFGLPPEQLSEEARQFITDRVRQAGGKVY